MDEGNFLQSFGLSDLELAVEQLIQISPAPRVDVADANVVENYFQPLEDALLRFDQITSEPQAISNTENYFQPLELALLEVNQTPSSSSSPLLILLLTVKSNSKFRGSG